MIAAQSAARVSPATPGGLRAPPAGPGVLVVPRRRMVRVNFIEDKKAASAQDADKMSLPQDGKPTDPKLQPEQFDELRYKEPGKQMYWPSSSEISPRTAEMKADMGSAIDVWQAQSFDGPAVETINSRLSMLGVPLGLFLEATTGQGLWQQTADHPLIVAGVVALFTVATYVPILKGYTRKEPYANSFLGFDFSPMAENWNGRLAMLGFAGMVLAEWITGVNTLQAWGLQDFPFLPPL